MVRCIVSVWIVCLCHIFTLTAWAGEGDVSSPSSPVVKRHVVKPAHEKNTPTVVYVIDGTAPLLPETSPPNVRPPYVSVQPAQARPDSSCG